MCIVTHLFLTILITYYLMNINPLDLYFSKTDNLVHYPNLPVPIRVYITVTMDKIDYHG